MIDLQAVYVREVAELSDVRMTAMVRIDNEPVDAIKDITLNGVSSSFFALDTRTLMVAIPASFMKVGQRQDLSKAVYGYVAEGINDIQIHREYRSEDGETYSQKNTIQWNNDGVKFKSPPGTRKITLDTSVIRLLGSRLDKAVKVLVNGKSMPFTHQGRGEIVTVIPENDNGVKSIDVITTAERISKRSFFEYMMGNDTRVVSGSFKLVQQFLKVLMTTPGTDIFNREMGGNMQNWVGQRISMKNPQSLISKTVLNIVQTGITMTLAQARSNLPADEMLTDVQVLNAQLDPEDPSVMNLSIRLNTFAGRSAFFSMILSEVQTIAADAQASLNG